MFLAGHGFWLRTHILSQFRLLSHQIPDFDRLKAGYKQASNMKLNSLLGLLGLVAGRNDDLFNYGPNYVDEDGANSFGQPDWEDVSCDNINTCVRVFASMYMDV
mgnify:CR=1 FL=1